MKVLMISGSNRPGSSNLALLKTIPNEFEKHQFQFFNIAALPLFSDSKEGLTYPEITLEWRRSIENADLVIICTPEYLHNIPAALKNALEWITQSGELAGKKVLPLTYTPSPPRGEKAMQSLIWSLKALDANIIGQMDMYQNDSSSKTILYEVLLEVLVDK